MFRKDENVCGIVHAYMCKKENIFRQRRLDHSGVGGGNAFKRVYPAQAYPTLVVLVFMMRSLTTTGDH